MTLFVCWLLFPTVMVALSLGCGLLAERAAGARLPFELLLPTGFAAIVAVSLFATLSSKTAVLTLPLVLALATVGLATAVPPSLRRVDLWAVASAVGVFAVFAAPVVVSGDATFAGYVKLDDTATFLALTDRALEHGRSLEGLAPSSYEAALAVNLPFYPLGSLLPLGIGGTLVGQDTAWVFQPYVAFLAALLGLALYRLAGLVVESRPARAGAAVLAAQAALLYGYALWGGVKEVAAAALVALAAALTAEALKAGRSPRSLLPLGLAAAGLVGVLSIGGVVWLLPALAVLAFTHLRRRPSVKPLVVVGAAALLVPSLVVTRLMLGEGVLSSIRDQSELGNLVAALSPLQIFGVWPAGDFRFEPGRIGVAYVLIAVTALAAVAGLALAVTRRAWELPLYLAAVLGAALVYGSLGSPWIEAKAFAIASPAVVLAAVAGALALLAARQTEGAVVLGAIVLGVAWSNVLAFGDATLAPRDQLKELETIGEQFQGQGPALMTEYQPYGVRHFLRELDAEGASELRRRPIPLRNGSTVPKAGFADIAAFRPDAIRTYRTLVLRRTPVGSRPPAPYRLVWQRRFYEVWQRPDAIPVSSVSPSAGATKPLPIAGTTVSIPQAGRYELWVAGSIRGELTGLVDGRPVGRVRHQLNHEGQYTSIGQVELSAGPHAVGARHQLSRFKPGEGGDPWALGPLLVTRAERCR